MAKHTVRRLRTLAINRSLFTPTTLPRAVKRLGFVQADPIRAPARAQDLILRHRVKGYRAGDLERRYPAMAMEEDVLYVKVADHPIETAIRLLTEQGYDISVNADKKYSDSNGK